MFCATCILGFSDLQALKQHWNGGFCLLNFTDSVRSLAVMLKYIEFKRL